MRATLEVHDQGGQAESSWWEALRNGASRPSVVLLLGHAAPTGVFSERVAKELRPLLDAGVSVVSLHDLGEILKGFPVEELELPRAWSHKRNLEAATARFYHNPSTGA